MFTDNRYHIFPVYATYSDSETCYRRMVGIITVRDDNIGRRYYFDGLGNGKKFETDFNSDLQKWVEYYFCTDWGLIHDFSFELVFKSKNLNFTGARLELDSAFFAFVFDSIESFPSDFAQACWKESRSVSKKGEKIKEVLDDIKIEICGVDSETAFVKLAEQMIREIEQKSFYNRELQKTLEEFFESGQWEGECEKFIRYLASLEEAEDDELPAI